MRINAFKATVRSKRNSGKITQTQYEILVNDRSPELIARFAKLRENKHFRKCAKIVRRRRAKHVGLILHNCVGV
jgi:hypothetical protein